MLAIIIRVIQYGLSYTQKVVRHMNSLISPGVAVPVGLTRGLSFVWFLFGRWQFKMGLLFAAMPLCIAALLTAHPPAAEAQEKSSGDLRSATQNPTSSMYSLPFKSTFDNGADNGDANILNIQPVLPVTVGEWKGLVSDQ
jgi:hypothetical protein